LGFDDLAAGQADAYLAYNANLRRIEAMFGAVEAITNTPPGSPGNGLVWAVGTAPTGAWAGKAGQLAHWYNSAWSFYVVPQYTRHWNKTGNVGIQFNGTAWA
jgi:hypothetical protein